MTAAEPDTRDARSVAFWVPALLLVLSAALIAAGVVFLVRAGGSHDDPAENNRAYVDRSATSQVIGQVSTGLQQVLTYDYAKPQVAQAAAKKFLTGDAPKQYQTLLTQLQKLSAGQKLSFVARVVSAGVVTLQGDTATLLVFVDQQGTRAATGQSSVSAGQVQVGAVEKDGAWRIDNLQPL